MQKEAAEHSKDWKIGMVAFDHVLSALKEVRAQHDKDQRGQHAADSDSSSGEEDEEAPAAQPPKKKARTQQVAAEHPSSALFPVSCSVITRHSPYLLPRHAVGTSRSRVS